MSVRVQLRRSSTASKRPTNAILEGEVALNFNDGTSGAFFKNASGNIVKLGPAEVGSTAPNATPAAGGSAGNSAGEMWYDTSVNTLKVYNGTAWVSSTSGSLVDGDTSVTVNGTTDTVTFNTGGTDRWVIDASGNFVPAADSTYNLGASGTEIASAFIDTVNVSTSADLLAQAPVKYFDSDSSNFIAFQAPATVAADVTFTWPDADGTASQVLTTDGSGALSWADSSASSITDGTTSVSVNGTTGTIDFQTSGSSKWQINTDGDFVPQTGTQDIGTSGTPVQDVFAGNLTGTLLTASQTNVTGVGTLTAGTWNADLIGAEFGGSGLDGSAAPNGSLLIGNGAGYTLSTLTAGTGIDITNAAGSITPSIADTTVTAAAYGAADTIATFTVDQQGRLTAAADVSVSIVHTQVSDFDAGVQANTLDTLAAPVASVAFNAQTITGLADPVNDQDAATKNYVDSVAQGLDPKDAALAGTTGNLTLNGTQTVDGVVLSVGDRVLVKDQTAQADNGIYNVQSGAWTRTEDADTWDKLVGAFVFVTDGTVNENNGFVATIEAGGTLGVTPVTWGQFSGAGSIEAGTGMTKTGNTLDVVGTADRIVANADSLDIAATYVGQTSLTTLGVVTTGTWNADIVGLAYGGTGVDNSSVNDGLAWLSPAYTDGASPGNASYRELLTTDVAPITGGSFDGGSF